MIMLLILKGLGLVEYFLDYLVIANMTVLPGSAATGGQWQLQSVWVNPTVKGWAILDDVWTLLHNVMDMLAQFSTLFPLNDLSGSYTVGNNVVGFTGNLAHP